MGQIGSGAGFSFAAGIIGLLGMGVNYPIYKRILKKGKQKYAFEILELAKDITAEHIASLMQACVGHHHEN